MTTLKSDKPVKFYGPAALMLPIGFHVAKTRTEQIDVLFSVADSPDTPRYEAEWLLAVIEHNLMGEKSDA